MVGAVSDRETSKCPDLLNQLSCLQIIVQRNTINIQTIWIYKNVCRMMHSLEFESSEKP